MTPINYSSYTLSLNDYFLYGLVFLTASGIISFLFYDSLLPVLFMLAFIRIYYQYVSRYLCNKRKQILILQFRDMINSISVSLNSGYSIENSIRETYREMLVLYGADSYIQKELELMIGKLAVNIPIEDIFSEFSSRSSCDDIIVFSQVLIITKRNGGDLMDIIRTSADTIGEKIDIQRDIANAIASKKFEQNIMFFMPVIIMIYIRASSKGFFSPVYHNCAGIILMTVCLAIYISAVVTGLKLSTVNL